MKPCAIRDWSNVRLAVALAILLGLALLCVALTGSLAATLVFIAAVLCIDLLWLYAAPKVNHSVVRLEMSAGIESRTACTEVGSVVQLDVVVKCSRPFRSVVISPLLTDAAEIVGNEGYGCDLEPAKPQHLVFLLRLLRSGQVVLPGVMVRSASPTRAFSSSRMIFDRKILTVLPNCFGGSHLNIATYLRQLKRGGNVRRRAVQGHGSDFRELRAFRYPDAMNRVDWKATARNRELIVREFEEPLDYTISVLLDVSPDMMHRIQRPFAQDSRERSLESGGPGAVPFDHALSLIGKLAVIAGGNGMTMRVVTYDDTASQEHRLQRQRNGYVRLLSELSAAPRAALVRAGLLTGEPFAETTWKLLNRTFSKSVHGWKFNSLDSDLQSYLVGAVTQSVRVEALADLCPTALAELAHRCARCNEVVFPDEIACRLCSSSAFEADHPLPRRAAQLAAAMTRMLGASRGRELLLVITALQGGECCEAIVNLLNVAAIGHRSVHVVIPSSATLADGRPVYPGSLGHQPNREDVLRNMEKLRESTQYRRFRTRLTAGKVQVHPLNDPAALDEVIRELLFNEVLAA